MVRGKATTKVPTAPSVVGRGKWEAQKTRILNRARRVTKEGWEYEANQRHGELIVQTLGMEEAKNSCEPRRGCESMGGGAG